jgi:hypothetical protein
MGRRGVWPIGGRHPYWTVNGGVQAGYCQGLGREAPKALPPDGPPGETTWPMRHAWKGRARPEETAALTGAVWRPVASRLSRCRSGALHGCCTDGWDAPRYAWTSKDRDAALFDDIDVLRTVGRFTTLHPDSDKPLCWTGHPDEARCATEP